MLVIECTLHFGPARSTPMPKSSALPLHNARPRSSIAVDARRVVSDGAFSDTATVKTNGGACAIALVTPAAYKAATSATSRTIGAIDVTSRIPRARRLHMPCDHRLTFWKQQRKSLHRSGRKPCHCECYVRFSQSLCGGHTARILSSRTPTWKGPNHDK